MRQKHSPSSSTLLFAAIMPTLAVSFGLHLLHNAWIAILLYHAWTLVAFMVLAMMGSTWRAVERRFKGLSMPILSHAAADFTMIVACYSSGEP